MKPWSWFWLALGLVAAVGEGLALFAFEGPGDTASEQVWMVLDAWPALALAGTGFLAWLAHHLFWPR